METQSNKPIAVLISDVHYNLNTLPLAEAAMNQAIALANKLEVPLIVAGDLHDSKANLRGECVNAMIATFKKANIKPYVLIGNHDLINERSQEHSLEFLRPYVNLIDKPKYVEPFGYLIPYQSDIDNLVDMLQEFPEGSQIIMHQGIQDSNSGDYFVDKTALPAACFDGFRVISGHYHCRQTIKCGKTGTFDYIGNPYTITYGEAKDPDKGIQILERNGSLRFVPTNLRRHVVLEVTAKELGPNFIYSPNDLFWFKVKGTYEELAGLSRSEVAHRCSIPETGWKLDFIVTDSSGADIVKEQKPNQTQSELLDALIDKCMISEEQKGRLKELWRKSAN